MLWSRRPRPCPEAPSPPGRRHRAWGAPGTQDWGGGRSRGRGSPPGSAHGWEEALIPGRAGRQGHESFLSSWSIHLRVPKPGNPDLDSGRRHSRRRADTFRGVRVPDKDRAAGCRSVPGGLRAHLEYMARHPLRPLHLLHLLRPLHPLRPLHLLPHAHAGEKGGRGRARGGQRSCGGPCSAVPRSWGKSSHVRSVVMVVSPLCAASS